MIPARTAKSLARIIADNVGEEKAVDFINRLIAVSGTRSSFKLVLTEIIPYAEKLSKRHEPVGADNTNE